MPKFLEVDKKEIDEFVNALGEFSAIIKKKAVRQLKDQGGLWRVKTPEGMVNLRRQLLETVKQGVLERKDLEVEIAILLISIFWNRKEMEKLARQRAEDRHAEAEATDEEAKAWEGVRSTGD